MPTTLPTRLPHKAARAARRHERPFAELAFVAAAILYLFLLAWDIASLETSFSLLPSHDLQGEYNPMEPSHRLAGRRAAAEDAR
ncbi:MAG TPA: hypothetical protein VGN55_13420 [Xanthobacteraceae bacterium]|jgi:hypothetical protein